MAASAVPYLLRVMTMPERVPAERPFPFDLAFVPTLRRLIESYFR